MNNIPRLAAIGALFAAHILAGPSNYKDSHTSNNPDQGRNPLRQGNHGICKELIAEGVISSITDDQIRTVLANLGNGASTGVLAFDDEGSFVGINFGQILQSVQSDPNAYRNIIMTIEGELPESPTHGVRIAISGDGVIRVWNMILDDNGYQEESTDLDLASTTPEMLQSILGLEDYILHNGNFKIYRVDGNDQVQANFTMLIQNGSFEVVDGAFTNPYGTEFAYNPPQPLIFNRLAGGYGVVQALYQPPEICINEP